MDKNTVWAILLSTLVLVVFTTLQMAFMPQQPTETAVSETGEIIQSESTETEAVKVSQLPVLEVSEENLKEEFVTITTESVKVTFTNRGGDIISYELLNHADKDGYIQMADNISDFNRAFSLSFGGAENGIINDLFHVKKINDYTVGFYKNFTSQNKDGSTNNFILAKQYTFDPKDYMFKLDVSIDGDNTMKDMDFNGLSYTVRTSPQIGPYYDAKNDRYENRTFMSYESKKKKNLLRPDETKVYDKDYVWTGVGGKYFEILVLPQNPTVMNNVVYSTKTEVSDYSNAQVMLTRDAINGNSVQDTYYFYVGPRTEKDLKIYNKSEDNPWNLSGTNLNASLNSSGILSWLETILKWCLEMINMVVRNWGLSIIVLTIIIKLLFYPLTKKSSLGTLKMKQIQPKVDEIQAKYKDQPEKLNAELTKLYKEENYNPLSGCLPLLIQFPILIAMYNLFNNYFEFRGAMFIPGWIPDLSVGDSIVALDFNIPFLGNHIRILPVIYLISQLLFGKLTQTNTATGSSATQMKIMMYGMPIFFFFILYNAPSGLILYWTVSNILQLVQQLIINKMVAAKEAEMELNKGPEKKVFVPRKK